MRLWRQLTRGGQKGHSRRRRGRARLEFLISPVLLYSPRPAQVDVGAVDAARLLRKQEADRPDRVAIWEQVLAER